MCDLGGVRIHGVNNHLDGRRVAACQGTVEIVRDNEKHVQIQLFERIFRSQGGRIYTGHLEVDILRQRIYEVPAFDRQILIGHTKPQVPNFRVEGEPEDHQYDGGRDHQLNDEAAIAPQLLEFFYRKSRVTPEKGTHLEPSLSLELHLAHLEYIDGVERQCQCRQRGHRPR